MRELGSELGWGDADQSYKALRVTLHVLRHRLPLTEAVQLGAQLPMLVRGFYYDGWKPVAGPDKHLDREELLEALNQAYRDDLEFDASAVLCSAL